MAYLVIEPGFAGKIRIMRKSIYLIAHRLWNKNVSVIILGLYAVKINSITGL